MSNTARNIGKPEVRRVGPGIQIARHVIEADHHRIAGADGQRAAVR